MFASREDMITGTGLLHTHHQRFGMLMHVGLCATETSEGSKSKTEAVYFPHRDTHIDEIRSNFDYLKKSSNAITVQIGVLVEQKSYIEGGNIFEVIPSCIYAAISILKEPMTPAARYFNQRNCMKLQEDARVKDW